MYDIGELCRHLEAATRVGATPEATPAERAILLFMAQDMVAEMRRDLFRERFRGPPSPDPAPADAPREIVGPGATLDEWLADAAEAFALCDYERCDQSLAGFEAHVEDRLPEWCAAYPELSILVERQRGWSQRRQDA